MPCVATAAAPAAERRALAAGVLAAGMVFLDGTALTVALPALGAELAASGPALLWVHNAFALPLAALILLGGAAGDVLGHRRCFLAGLGLFATASLGCALAPGTGVLIACRALQGTGGALLIPASLALLAGSAAPVRRGRAIGLWTAGTVLASALGPPLGGLLVELASWRWIFALNLPLAAAAAAWMMGNEPAGGTTRRPGPAALRQLDLGGAALAAAGLAALTAGLLGGAASPALIAIGAGLLAAACWVDRGHPRPLVPPAVLRAPTFALAAAVALTFYPGLYALLYLLPLTLITAAGATPLVAGLALLPLMAILVAASPAAGAWADRHGPRGPLALGPLLGALGFLTLAWAATRQPAAGLPAFLPGLLLLGAGSGLTFSPLTHALLEAAGKGHSGLGAGLNGTLSRLAGALGVAGIGALFFHRAGTGYLPADAAGAALAPAGVTQVAAAFALACTVAAALAAAGALLGWRLPSKRNG